MLPKAIVIKRIIFVVHRDKYCNLMVMLAIYLWDNLLNKMRCVNI